MRTLTTALVVGFLAGCGSVGTVDDGGRVYREAQNRPVDANLEPLAAEATIQLFNDRLPGRGDVAGGGRDEGEASACEAELWQHLIGMTETDVAAQNGLPGAVRVIEWDGMVTQDYVPSRLNVHLDQNGRAYRVICG